MLAVNVSNTGAVSGTEIVQAYLHDPLGVSLVIRSWKRLAAFGRTGELAPGSAVSLQLPVSADDLALFDDNMHLRVLPGSYGITCGGSAATDLLLTTVSISQELADAANACLATAYDL